MSPTDFHTVLERVFRGWDFTLPKTRVDVGNLDCTKSVFELDDIRIEATCFASDEQVTSVKLIRISETGAWLHPVVVWNCDWHMPDKIQIEELTKHITKSVLKEML